MARAQGTLQYGREVGKEEGEKWEAGFHVFMLTANILEARWRSLLLNVGPRRGDILWARNGVELQTTELESLQSLSVPGNWSCEGLIWMLRIERGVGRS